MARNSVRYKIDADPSGAKRGTREAERSVERMQRAVKGNMAVMAGAAAGAGLAFGAAGLAGIVGSSVQAFKESEKTASRLAAQLQTIGQNSDGTRKHIEKMIDAQSKMSAFDDEAVTESFTRILRVTGDVDKSLQLNALSMDIARARGIDLAAAGDAVAKAAGGNGTALRKMGVSVEKGAAALDILNAAQRQFAGQAKQYGESQAAAGDRTAVAWENVQERFGREVTPALAHGADALLDVAGAAGRVVDAAGGLGPVLTGVAGFGAMRLSANAAAGLGEALRVAAGDATVFSIASRKMDVSATARNMGGLRTVAKTTGGALSALAGGPMGLAALAAGGLALGVAHVISGMTDLEDEARDVAAAMAALSGAQLDSKGAALGVAQAEQRVTDARSRSAEAINAHRRAVDELAAATKNEERVGRDASSSDKERAAAKSRLRDATRAEKQTLTESKQAQLDSRQAAYDLETAQQRAARTSGQLSDATAKYSKELGGQITAAAAANTVQGHGSRIALGATQRTVDQTKAARDLAASMNTSAAANKGLTETDRKRTAVVAGLIVKLGRVPTKTEAKIISNAVSETTHVRDLKAALDVVDGRVVNISVKAETDRETRRILNSGGKPAPGGATGMYVSGAYGADDTTIRVTGGEAVLNPRQIAMIGADRVFGALAATGAPTIRRGAGYAGGGLPPHWRGGDAHAPKTPPDRDLDVFLGNARLDELALASSTLDETDDRVAARKAANRVSTILGRGTYRGRRLSRRERRMLLEALGGFRRDAQADPSSAGGGEDPFALDRAREAGVSEGLGRLSSFIFGGSRDIGTGTGANALASAGTLNVARVVIAPTTANHAELAGAANRGNSTWNRTRSYSSREGVAW